MILDRILSEIERREAAGVAPREIELSPRMWRRMLAEIGPAYLREFFDPHAARGSIYGVPVRKGSSGWCCRNCGAQREESHRCSYCLQPYDRITIDGEILQ